MKLKWTSFCDEKRKKWGFSIYYFFYILLEMNWCFFFLGEKRVLGCVERMNGHSSSRWSSLITWINGLDSMGWGRVQLEFELTSFGYTIFFTLFLFFLVFLLCGFLFFIFFCWNLWWKIKACKIREVRGCGVRVVVLVEYYLLGRN